MYSQAEIEFRFSSLKITIPEIIAGIAFVLLMLLLQGCSFIGKHLYRIK